ncbi:ankyrin repeat domain-containing protein [Sphingomonadaceae bacterium jetA1]|jgi:ankyrin repeat protein|uniref:ankyrin repeat domain-containing protein n=1 Tax=Facivitalis istanbulensis TaxID=3075838 RepID=UPI00347E5E1B
MFALLLPVLLAAAPAEPVNLPPPERRQALLFEAAKMGRTDLIPFLAKNGADVNAYEERGFTPLILAAYNGQAAAVEALLNAGADPCKPDRTQGNTAQMGVAFKGDDRIAARLLKAGCDINARNKAGQTALMMAALFGRTAQVKMLMQHGADPHLVDASGRSAASVAEVQGHSDLASDLARSPGH